MHYLSYWFIRNPVAGNLLMWLIIISGIFSLYDLRIEGFPKIPADSISIGVFYPGINAKQMDESVTQKIENSLEGISGIKRVVSFSFESTAEITIQKTPGYSLERLFNDAKVQVDSISNYPQDAYRPIITRDEYNFPAMIIQVYGDVDRDILQRIGTRVRTELIAQPEISKLKMWGDRNKEISIEISPDKLESLNLSIEDIFRILSENNLVYRTGTLKSPGRNITLRADNQAYSYSEFASIPIIVNGDGSIILLKDIADIKDGFEDDDSIVRFQGKPSIGMEIIISSKDNIINVSDAAHRVIDKMNQQLPENIRLDIWTDQSKFISKRLDLLQHNAFLGLILVFVLLAFFLNIRVAFWVAVGIPISIAGTLALMKLDTFGYSLNDITTFGFIIVLGLLVDDAVVIGESVFNERSKTSDPILASEKGVERVATATVFGILTTVAAFYPMLLIDNPIGKVLASFAGVVIIALFFSLLESKLILPAHLASIPIDTETSTNNKLVKFWFYLKSFFNRTLYKVNRSYYCPSLKVFLKYRYATLICFIAAATLGIGLIFTGSIKTTFFPDIPSSLISINLQMDNQSPLQLTIKNTNILENNAHLINKQLMDEFNLQSPPIERIMTAVLGADSVQIYAELAPEDFRPVKTLEVINRWRTLTGRLEGASDLTFSGSENTGGGFQVDLFANDEHALKESSKRIIKILSGYKGVNDIRDELKSSESEIRVVLKPEARHIGINIASIAAQIGNAYGGLEVQRIQRNSDEVKVIIRYPESSRNSLDQLMNSRIQISTGERVPILSVAELHSSYTAGAIVRQNGKLATSIKANIDKTIISPKDVFAALKTDVESELQSLYPDLIMKPAGELEQEGELKGGLIRALLMAMLIIYILLAIPLKSYTQPFIIMSVVPFGFAGAAMGHLIADIPLSVLSFFGMVALTGIVVNDSLVMLTCYNQLREEGMSMDDALIEAGSSRFRAIFLTTVTTVAGLLPLLSETSEQAQYLIPAAVSLAYGEMFATVITLVIIPLLMKIASDFKRKKVAN
ncbi:MAG: efflux RND transporter permease subunit [Pseudomonadota bacterium]